MKSSKVLAIAAATGLALVLLTVVRPAFASGSVIQTCGSGTGGTTSSISCAFGSDVSSPDLIAVFIATYAGCITPAFSDTGTASLGAWNQSLIATASGWTSLGSSYVYDAIVSGTGTLTVVFSCGGAGVYYAIDGLEISGLGAVSAAVDSGVAGGDGTKAISYAAGDVIVSNYAGTSANAALAGWTAIGGSLTWAGSNPFDSDYQAPSSSGTFTTGWTVVAASWFMINAVFSPAASQTTTATTTATTTVTSTTTTYNSTTTTTQDVINNQGAFAAVVIGSVIVCFVMIAILVARRR